MADTIEAESGEFPKKDDIQQYWDQRANELATDPAATTNDVYLRDLEAKTLIHTLTGLELKKGARVLDVGCGNGYTLLLIAKALPELHFTGMDYSPAMIAAAKSLLNEQPDLQERVSFTAGDAMNLDSGVGDALFDVVMSDRCLINLPSLEDQAKAIESIAMHVAQGGHYIAIENFVEGQQQMNLARRSLGLPEITVRWHNLFFQEAEFKTLSERFFTDIAVLDFASSYYFATRVIYSKYCMMKGEEPDYRHEIHQFAGDLPPTDGYCPIKMVSMARRD